MSWLLWLALLGTARAEPPPCDFGPDTPAGLYLVTFAPGDDLTAVFGHTLLLDFDPRKGDRSKTYDFGHFDPNAPDFLWNFVSNQQDYRLETRELRTIRRVYGKRDRDGIAQRLTLSTSDRLRVTRGLQRRIRESHGLFRYHWYHSNCTTEVRDALATVLGAGFEAQHAAGSGSTPRREVLRHSAHHPLWFALHWGSGGFADREISHWDRSFVPEILMNRLRETTHGGTGLVESECQLTTGSLGFPPPAPPRRDVWLALVGIALAAGLAGLFSRARRLALVATGAWGLVTGVFGSAALIVGVMGTFAPFWGMHNLPLASPANLLLPVAAVGALWRREARWPVWLAGVVGGLWGLALVWALVRLAGDYNLGLLALFAATPTAAVGVWRARPGA